MFCVTCNLKRRGFLERKKRRKCWSCYRFAQKLLVLCNLIIQKEKYKDQTPTLQQVEGQNHFSFLKEVAIRFWHKGYISYTARYMLGSPIQALDMVRYIRERISNVFLIWKFAAGHRRFCLIFPYQFLFFGFFNYFQNK